MVLAQTGSKQLSKPVMVYIDGLVQDCSNSIALAMEWLQSCTKLSIYTITGLDSCLLPVRGNTIIYPRATVVDRYFLIGPFVANLNGIWIKIQPFYCKFNLKDVVWKAW